MPKFLTFLCMFSILITCLTPPVFAGETVILENSLLRLSFDSDTGALTGMLNKKTGSEYIQRSSGKAPFILDVYSANQSIYIRDYVLREFGGLALFNPDSIKYYPGDLSFLRGDGVKPKVELIETKDGESIIECVYAVPPAFTVTTKVTVRKNSPITTWKISVRNEPAKHPKDDIRLFRVAFPVLEGLSLGGKHEDDYLARPMVQGQLIPDPVSYSFENPKHWATRVNVMTYMGWATMPWQDLYDDGGGLYFASYDPTFQQIDIETFPQKDQGTLTMDIRTLAFVEPGSSWDSQTFIVSIHQGDWHWAADRYRIDSKTWLHPVSKPEWIKYSDGWYGTGGPNYKFADLPDMYEDAKWLGLNYLQVWSEMMESVGEGGSRKMYYCFFIPDPDRGGEKAITEAVKKIRAEGGHIGFYSNAWTFDAEVPRTLNRVRDKIPPEIPIPDWWKEFRSYASVFPDGSRKAGNYMDDGRGREEIYAGMCPAAEGWQDYLKYWIVDKYCREYGVDTWYLDSFPVTMFGAARICFSDEHGPGVPHGVSRAFLEVLKKLKNSSYGTVNLAITSETVSDALMQYQTHALGLELLSHLIDYPKPEIYAFSFPEFPIFSGTCNGANVQIYYPGEKVTREDTMNRVYLMAHRFDILGYPLQKDQSFWKYMKKLIVLRQSIKDELYNSHFRDEIGLENLPEKVEAKIFCHVEKTSLTVNIIDRRENKNAFTLKIDPKEHGVNNLKQCHLYTFEGKKKLSAKKSRGVFSIKIPARKNNVVSIILSK